jgi:hypothetical protein
MNRKRSTIALCIYLVSIIVVTSEQQVLAQDTAMEPSADGFGLADLDSDG